MPDNKVTAEPFILFELAGTTYGIPSRTVQQMEMIEHITPVPNALPAVEGIVFLRGQVIPAVNLRAQFGFPKIPIDIRTRLVVLHEHDRTVGLVVDTAREFVRLPNSSIQPVPEAMPGVSSRYLKGVAYLDGRLVLILDTDAVLEAHDDLVLPAVSASPEQPAASAPVTTVNS
jgi:purine-binding chemotaxis protein CheW